MPEPVAGRAPTSPAVPTRYGTLTARARAGGWGALTRLVRINVRIDHTMRDGNARSGPAANSNTRRTEESLMHESAIYASPDPPWLWGRCSRGAVESASANDVAGPGQAVCVPCVTLLSPIADGAIARTRGGCGARGPGGRCRARARESPRPASGGRRGVPVRRIPAGFCEVPRHCPCGARVSLRASRLNVPPTAPMAHAAWAWRRGRGSRPEPGRPGAPSSSARSTLGPSCRSAYTNTKLHGSFADRPRPISREFSFTHFVTDALPPASRVRA